MVGWRGRGIRWYGGPLRGGGKMNVWYVSASFVSVFGGSFRQTKHSYIRKYQM